MDDAGRWPLQVCRYVARFDRQEYWLAHEELEEHWQGDRRDPYKGMIQLAAAFVHIERSNWRGARRLLSTALDYLSEAPAQFEGFDIEALRHRTAAVLGCVTRLADGEADRFDDSLTFQMSPLFAGRIADGIVRDVALPYRVRRYDEGYRPVSGPSSADDDRHTSSSGGDRSASRPEDSR